MYCEHHVSIVMNQSGKIGGFYSNNGGDQLPFYSTKLSQSSYALFVREAKVNKRIT